MSNLPLSGSIVSAEKKVFLASATTSLSGSLLFLETSIGFLKPILKPSPFSLNSVTSYEKLSSSDKRRPVPPLTTLSPAFSKQTSRTSGPGNSPFPNTIQGPVNPILNVPRSEPGPAIAQKLPVNLLLSTIPSFYFFLISWTIMSYLDSTFGFITSFTTFGGGVPNSIINYFQVIVQPSVIEKEAAQTVFLRAGSFLKSSLKLIR